ncbi:uncharacterized protein MYCFIDRAFT_206082 [Pseudocercospora fijiensis CIRAD86]|uniref:Uncharacterized protein n=1 Tax=Pseudocercospora fijiensis (strain CIRAD86) TaxID=383855 RepID=N1QBS3_PSEFD|nr:uncharacterized protein MYCFIDRAFT_206082 [Pseudocercospora fijiensis CIRAD86]EME88658.1 hypothetical protein MYCFIDRAFT_206082 [Pseudocercospora fijiensis CIRAD86]
MYLSHAKEKAHSLSFSTHYRYISTCFPILVLILPLFRYAGTPSSSSDKSRLSPTQVYQRPRTCKTVDAWTAATATVPRLREPSSWPSFALLFDVRPIRSHTPGNFPHFPTDRTATNLPGSPDINVALRTRALWYATRILIHVRRKYRMLWSLSTVLVYFLSCLATVPVPAARSDSIPSMRQCLSPKSNAKNPIVHS